jgi:tetratricopeptide (TPR) repeat protein
MIPVQPAPVQGQASEIQVLVAPLVVGGGVDRRFGERVADEVRKALEDFGGLLPIDEGDVNDVLKQFGLKKEEMTPIEWRQLAGRMNAQMVMIGTALPTGGGVTVDVAFLDPRTGDELPVQPFTVPDDGKHKEAALQITQDLEEGVEYQRSIAFCSEYLSSNQLDDAMRNCDRAIAINPNSSRGRYLLGRIKMEMGSWDEAVQDLEQVVSENPSNTEALQSLAYTHAQLGNKSRSLELYRDYLNFNPDDAAVRLNIAYELATAGGSGEAMTILQEGVERDAENADLWEYLGSVALAKGTEGNGDGGENEVTDPEAVRVAVTAFDRVLSLKGDKIAPSILSNVIVSHMLLGDYEGALEFSDRAITIIENPPATDGTDAVEASAAPGGDAPSMTKEELLASIHSRRADVYSRMERHDEAAAAITRAMEYDPELNNAHMRRALFRLRSGDSDGAIADFRSAVSRGADADQIANSLFSQGYSEHFQQRQYGAALQVFQTALEFAQAPDVSHQIHFFAAYSYYQQGTAIDSGNQSEACGPARNALSTFRNVMPHLNQSGSYQANSQAQIRDAVDVQLYRQEQIIRKACS